MLKTIKFYGFECDGCDERLGAYPTRGEALDAAGAEGWVTTTTLSHKTYCPGCWAMIEAVTEKSKETTT